MSEDPTRPLPSRWRGQPGWSPQPPGQVTPPGSAGPAGPPAGGYRNAGRRRRVGHRGLIITGIVVLILIMLLVIADRVAAAVAENEIASQIKSHGFPVKPHVTITGFPFLTQVVARDFHQVNISARNVPEGPADIASINATLRGVHLNAGFNSATVDQLNGTALI